MVGGQVHEGPWRQQMRTKFTHQQYNTYIRYRRTNYKDQSSKHTKFNLIKVNL